MINTEEIRQMSDEELYALSLVKDKNGRYTREANAAYAERQRRKGGVHYAGVAGKCSKYEADFDYYGTYIN